MEKEITRASRIDNLKPSGFALVAKEFNQFRQRQVAELST